MAFLADAVLDNGLQYITDNGDTLHLTSQQCTTSADVTSYSLGYKNGITVGAPANNSTDGRRVTISAISDGTIDGDGDATHYTVVQADGTVIASQLLTGGGQTVTSGNVFTLDEFDVIFPDA